MARGQVELVVSFTIALTAPIIDLILRGGVGAKMNYLAINSWKVRWCVPTSRSGREPVSRRDHGHPH
ncbi:MAG: hypothetical protein IPP17_07650 [Bacteroidetes bacterium]|nr:hypothetical protein [Bacteroidota bacterium]